MSAAPAGAAFPGDNGKIAFDSERDSEVFQPEQPDEVTGTGLEQVLVKREVYSMNPDASDQTRLTEAETCSANPAWSADGKKIVFVRNPVPLIVGPIGLFYPCSGNVNGEIWTMDADGGNQLRITQEELDAEPAWSPDGTKIVFRRGRQGDADIYVVNSDGSGTPENITDDFDETAVEPAWSPNGARIAFTGNTSDSGFHIHTMNPDGGGVVDVSAVEPLSEFFFDDDPDWSPDGSKLAFRRTTEGGESIWSMSAGGNGGAVNLTPDDPKDNERDDEAQPAWSPDGTRITFSRGDCCNEPSDIYTMAAGGGDERNLSEGTDFREVHPNWQPIPRPVVTTTPPPPTPAARRDTRRPRVAVAAVRGCTASTRLRVPVRINERGGIRSVVVRLDGRRILTTKRTRFTLRINARRLRAGRHRLRIVATDASGNRTTVNRTFARCAQRVAPRRPTFTG